MHFDSQSDAPICDALEKYVKKDVTSFRIPGHKSGKGIDAKSKETLGTEVYELDVPMMGGLDDRKESKELRARAEKLAAHAYGADTLFFSENGSSLSSHVSVTATLEPGDAVAVPRNAHKSLIDACVFAGARGVFLDCDIDEEQNIEVGVSPATVEKLLKERPDIKSVYVVSPSYYGVVSPIKEIARVCHEHDVILAVDEAWGAHYPFCKGLPSSGIADGADLCFVSIHKTMGALQQGSVVMCKGQRIDVNRLRRCVKMFESTSPSSLLLSSIDTMRRYMVHEGEEQWSRVLKLAGVLRAELQKIEGIRVLGENWAGRPGFGAYDYTKIVMDVSGLNMTGYAACDWLTENESIEFEMGDERRLVGILTLADDESTMGRMVQGIQNLATNAPKTGSKILPPLGSVGGDWVLAPGTAFYGPTEMVSIDKAVGRISAELVCPYPPGIPRVKPGEVITEHAVEYMKEAMNAGAHISDADDPTLKKLTVVAKARR